MAHTMLCLNPIKCLTCETEYKIVQSVDFDEEGEQSLIYCESDKCKGNLRQWQ